MPRLASPSHIRIRTFLRVQYSLHIDGLSRLRLPRCLIEQHLSDQLFTLKLDGSIISLRDALIECKFGVGKLENVLFDCALGNQPINSQ